MKHIKLTLLLIFLLKFSFVFSQTPEPVLAKAIYKFSHQRDSTNSSNIFTDEMVLLLGKSSSVYKSLQRMISDSILLAKVKNAGNLNSITPSGKLGSPQEILLYQFEKKAFQIDFMVNRYIHPIDFPVIAWKVLSDTTTISGLKCQKAIGEWKGRIYNVWFCPDLPFKAGPWKLNGLPGLIINAQDTKNQVSFTFYGFQSYKGEALFTAANKEVIMTSSTEFDRLQEAFLENPTTFIKSIIPEIQEINYSKPYKRKPPINNPIELKK